MIRIEHNEPNLLFPYIEYVPANAEGKLPLVVQLHGAGERGCGGDELYLVDKLGFSNLIADRDIPCRFVMPQCPKGGYWACRVESVLAFIDYIVKAFPTDTDRIYLTGMSMGGFGTWFTATAAPDRFAAIAPVCGGGMSWAADMLKMPIWTFHGTEDDIVPINYTVVMVEALKSCGADVRYSRLEGVWHNAWDYAYTDDLLNWLLSKTK